MAQLRKNLLQKKVKLKNVCTKTMKSKAKKDVSNIFNLVKNTLKPDDFTPPQQVVPAFVLVALASDPQHPGFLVRSYGLETMETTMD